MSTYLVIARKWRPSLFEEIVGQEHVTRTLVNAVGSGHVAHAYLFSGPRGVGKTTAARILAKCLNCVKGPTPTPCNECTSCKGVTSGSSVDVFEIDGASNTSVDNVRDLRESVRYVPTNGKYKVYIIDEVHMLSTAAFNALLKTLEEPPPHAVFIFATTEAHKIPLTILSRCQRFDFKRIPFKEIELHLEKIVTKEGINFAPGALYAIAREADGSLRDAQSLLDQTLAFAGGAAGDGEAVTQAHVSEALGLMDRDLLYSLARAVVEKDVAGCLNVVEKIYDFGYDLKRASADLLEVVRDITVIKLTGRTSLVDLPDSEIERLESLADSVGTDRLHMIFNIVSRGYEEVARSAYPRYSLEMALLKAAHFDEVRPVTELIARLEGLKRESGATRAQGAPTHAGSRRGPARSSASAPNKESAPLRPHGAAEQASEYGTAERAEEGPVESTGATDAEALVNFIKKKIPGLAALIGNGVVEFDTDAVGITVAAKDCALLKMKENQLQSVCTEFLKKDTRINIKAGTAAESAGSTAAQTSPAQAPVIKDALRILGGRVISGAGA